MAVETNQVFLVPGQRLVPGNDGVMRLAPEIESQVVIANNAQDAQAVLAQADPQFNPLGFTSLADYEDAVIKLRQALNGEKSSWPLWVAEGMLEG